MDHFCLVIVLVTLLTQCIYGYKIVFIIHGVMGDAGTLQYLTDYIKQAHPGTEVHNMNLYPDYRSLERLWTQTDGFKAEIERLIHNRTEQVHLIGYSQGGLVARGVVQSWDDHPFSTFISLSSPQAGQFGDGFLHLVFPGTVRNEAFRLFYSRFGQLTSVGNYWNDPREQAGYLKYSQFLAPIDNEVFSNDTKRYRRNLLRLKRLVMIGGPDDGVITPWQSSHFSFYNANLTVVDVRERDGYRSDAIGLKTLDKRSGLRLFTYSGIHHTLWHHNITVIRQAILPFLD